MTNAPAFTLKGLTGREYKMLLKPKKFRGSAEAVGRRFWTRRLKAIVEKHCVTPPDR